MGDNAQATEQAATGSMHGTHNSHRPDTPSPRDSCSSRHTTSSGFHSILRYYPVRHRILEDTVSSAFLDSTYQTEACLGGNLQRVLVLAWVCKSIGCLLGAQGVCWEFKVPVESTRCLLGTRVSPGSMGCLLGAQNVFWEHGVSAGSTGFCWEHRVYAGNTGCLLGARGVCWEHQCLLEAWGVCWEQGMSSGSMECLMGTRRVY